MEQHSSPRGLIIVHTGDGKGKTTAALGLALRAVGHGQRVLMVQFIKSNRRTGECLAAERLAPLLRIETLGCGFVKGEWTERDIAAARNAWQVATQAFGSGEWDMVILDEITYPLRGGALELGEVLAALAAKPPTLHVVLTGRNAHPELVAAADLVTEMIAVKHPFEAGIRAQKGIEW